LLLGFLLEKLAARPEVPTIAAYWIVMGCLPVIALFVLGAGLGWWLGGDIGAVWGAGIGLAVGIVAGIMLVLILRRARSASTIDQ
jgi:hypothetical protein